MGEEPSRPTAPARAGTPRFACFDGLRLVWFLAIFVFHESPNAFWYASYALPGFFVLSGWLITRLLVHEGRGGATRRAQLTRFYIRRTLRLFPAYYVTLAIVALTIGTPLLTWFATYTTNFGTYAISRDPSLCPECVTSMRTAWRDTGIHFWSLAVEEQFYLSYPIVFIFFQRSFWRWAPFALVVTIAAHAYCLITHDPGYYGALPWIAGEYIVWGCLAGMFRGGRPLERAHGVALTFVAIAILVVLSVAFDAPARADQIQFRPSFVQTLYGPTLAALMVGLYSAPDSPIARVLALRPVAWLGERTYAMYLVHLFSWAMARGLCRRFPFLLGEPSFMLRLAITIGLGILSWYVVERPFLVLRERIAVRFPSEAEA